MRSVLQQARNQDFRRGVTCVSDVNVCMHKHARLEGSGGMLAQKIRWSEFASGAILGQKQSRI